jgi:hypothetical protein
MYRIIDSVFQLTIADCHVLLEGPIGLHREINIEEINIIAIYLRVGCSFLTLLPYVVVLK